MEYITLGKVINVRGLQGELKLYCSTDFSKQRYKKGNKVSFYNEETKDRKEFTIKKYTRIAQNDYIFVEEIKDVDTANKYREYLVQIPKEELHHLEEGSYYFHELIGCKVYDHTLSLKGEVIKIESNGPQEILRIKTDKKDVLIPFIDVFLKEVNVEDKKIILNEMVGFFE